MKVTFRINYKTVWGQNLWLAGSSEALGAWNHKSGFPLTHVGNGEWEAVMTFNSKDEFEYKYFIVNEDGSVFWEGGNNRKFGPFSYKSIEIRDFWRPQIDDESALFSKVFANVLFSRNGKVKNLKKAKSSNVIRFNMRAPRVSPSQTMAIVGNSPALGDWNKPVLMSDSDFPCWSAEFDLSEMIFPIEYKYVIVDTKSGNIDLWEDGEERKIFYINPDDEKILHVRNDEKFRYSIDNWKGSGVAVPVFSLRTNDSFGVGEFNDLKKLVDWAKIVGMKLVQVLPINETIATHSWLDSYPYKAISVIALHPMYLNLDKLGKLDDEKLMDEFEVAREVLNAKTEVDYIEVMNIKSRYYKLIFDQNWNEEKETDSYKAFFEANKHWLEDYAAFCFLRDRYATSNFRKWGVWSEYKPEKIKKICNPESEHFEHIAVHYFIQYHLDLQLREAIDYGHKNGIAFKGDIPIGISPDSIEAWTNPELFNLNGQAGAPPDDFAILGQNWGFPTYNWEKMAEDGFAWWKKRLSMMSQYFDAYRIDHILGFFRIWEIPKNAIHGLLGFFKPGMPLTPDEIRDRGVWFDEKRFTKPYIRGHFLNEIFGMYAEEVMQLYLTETEYNVFEIKEQFDTQKKIYTIFTPEDGNEEKLKEKEVIIRDGLISLLDEVLFIKDPYAAHPAYHPRISMHYSYSFRELDHETKNNLDRLYIDFYYKRHEEFWKNEALKKLPALINASNMLVCGEDLGMVPDCVPEVMKGLNILSLEIQRMPKNPDIEFGHPSDAPYLSVSTPSTHDMSTIRGWWEENREKTRLFYRYILGHNDEAPEIAEPWICKEIINQHMYSSSMLTIFPIQDLIAIDGKLRWSEIDKERINVPSDEKNKWKYRMILPLEELINSTDFNEEVSEMISRSGRNTKL